MLFTVDPKTFILIYLSLCAGSILLYWTVSHLFWPKKKITLECDALTQCAICLCRYLAEESTGPSKCPTCHSYNDSNS